jgi:16S rRNA G527 N7-methylase RsmG
MIQKTPDKCDEPIGPRLTFFSDVIMILNIINLTTKSDPTDMYTDHLLDRIWVCIE